MNTVRWRQIVALVLIGWYGVAYATEQDQGHDVSASLMPDTVGWVKKYSSPIVPGGALSNDYYQDPRPGKEGRWVVETFEVRGRGDTARRTLLLRRWNLTLEGGEYKTGEMYSALFANGTWIFSDEHEEVYVVEKTMLVDTSGDRTVVLRFSFTFVTQPDKERIVCLVYGDTHPGVPVPADDEKICKEPEVKKGEDEV